MSFIEFLNDYLTEPVKEALLGEAGIALNEDLGPPPTLDSFND